MEAVCASTVFKNAFKFLDYLSKENGNKVVDIWGGLKEFDGKPWERNTTTKVFSTTKTIVALAVNMLVDRGLLAYDEKISKYWPEFKGDERENITLTQLLSHRAFYPEYNAKNWDEIANEDLLAEKLATAPLSFTHGVVYYHCIHRDFYLAQIIRKVDPKHRDAATFIEEEIMKPLIKDDGDLQLHLKTNEILDATRARMTPMSFVHVLFRVMARVYIPDSVLQFFGIPLLEGEKKNFQRGKKNVFFPVDKLLFADILAKGTASKVCSAVLPKDNSQDPNDQ